MQKSDIRNLWSHLPGSAQLVVRDPTGQLREVVAAEVLNDSQPTMLVFEFKPAESSFWIVDEGDREAVTLAELNELTHLRLVWWDDDQSRYRLCYDRNWVEVRYHLKAMREHQ